MKSIDFIRINNITICFIIAGMIVVQSCSLKPKIDSSNPQNEINTIELLRNDHRNKNISNDDYYLFLTYAIFSPQSLPVNYQGTVGPKDGTPVIIEVKRAFHTLTPDSQKIIRQWIRPLPKKPQKRKL